jgi:hypothetical protein
MKGGASTPGQAPRSARALPPVIPLFPLPGAILLPRGQLPLNIFEPRYLRMVEDALGSGRVIGMIQPRDGDLKGKPPLYDVGCAGRITTLTETNDGRFLITLTGLMRFRIAEELETDTPYRQARTDYAAFAHDVDTDRTVGAVDRDALFAAMRDYLQAENLKADWEEAAAAPTEALVTSLAMGCPFAPNEKQALLEAPTIAERAQCLIALMRMGCGEPPSDQTIQ